MTNLDDGMFETTYINKQVKVGNSKKMTATKIVKWRGVIENKDDTKKNIILDKVKLVPELWNNLFSIRSLLKKLWNLSKNRHIISLSNNNFKFSFDWLFMTKDGFIMGINNQSNENLKLFFDSDNRPVV